MAQRRFNFIKNSNAYILHESRIAIHLFRFCKLFGIPRCQFCEFKVGVPVNPAGHRFLNNPIV